jgi:hypothetical protein
MAFRSSWTCISNIGGSSKQLTWSCEDLSGQSTRLIG